MAKQRDAIRMSEGEIVEMLKGCKSLQVATLDADGSAHLTTVWYAYEDGKYLFETYGKSQKIVNLQRDPRISVLAEDGSEYHELRGVSVKGRAEIVDEEPRLLDLMTRLVAHHFPGLDAKGLDETARNMAKKRVVVVVHPEKVMSWDHRKIAAG